MAPHLLGVSLASFRRRSAAFVLDVVLFGILIGGLFVGLTIASFHREDPTLLARLGDAAAGKEARQQAIVDFLHICQERCPEMLPHEMRQAVAGRNVAALNEHWNPDANTTVGFGSGPTELLPQGDQYMLTIGTDLLLGGFSSVLSWGGFFVGWFTLWTRLTRGRTPGKWLWRIRVIRLDGRALSWWDCFGRAGGYGASAATAMLGFLEALWDPNRQALHDRIAGTVVRRI